MAAAAAGWATKTISLSYQESVTRWLSARAARQIRRPWPVAARSIQAQLWATAEVFLLALLAADTRETAEAQVG